MNLRRSILVRAVVVVVLWGYILVSWVFGSDEPSEGHTTEQVEPKCRTELVESDQGSLGWFDLSLEFGSRSFGAVSEDIVRTTLSVSVAGF